MNFLKFYKAFLIVSFVSLCLVSCGGGGGDDDDPYVPPTPTEIIPSNLTLDITIVGKDATNTNGDGSGTIKCVASATDAVKYEFRFGVGDVVENASGIAEYTFTEEGVNSYTVYVYAYSSTDHSINTAEQISVYVEPFSFNELVWSDEFNVDGSPNTSNWTYDLGNGDWGWGNNESQYYTNRSDNVIVEDGMLKITAKKENYQGYEYTSTRMKTQDKFDFTYGKVEVKAKLPQGVGTWPAIWMLGSDFWTNTWPACGEIDIMEHVGYDQGNIHSSLHTTSSSGATNNTSTKYISDVSTAFHVYGVEWTSEKIVFTVDGEAYYTYGPSNKTSANWPFDSNQFIILNIAMGGTWGGVNGIDSNFTESTMEIDYVRVYQ